MFVQYGQATTSTICVIAQQGLISQSWVPSSVSYATVTSQTSWVLLTCFHYLFRWSEVRFWCGIAGTANASFRKGPSLSTSFSFSANKAAAGQSAAAAAPSRLGSTPMPGSLLSSKPAPVQKASSSPAAMLLLQAVRNDQCWISSCISKLHVTSV